MESHIKLFENHLFEEDLERINILMKQLSSDATELDWPTVEAVLHNSTIFVLRDTHPEIIKKHPKGMLIGKTTLIHSRKMFAFFGTIEDVVVDENYRGQGLGKLLTNRAIEKARKLGMKYIDLTSSPDRIPANNLYKSLGFELRKTNPYRLKL